MHPAFPFNTFCAIEQHLFALPLAKSSDKIALPPIFCKETTYGFVDVVGFWGEEHFPAKQRRTWSLIEAFKFQCCEREQSVSRKERTLAFSVHFSANTPHNPELEWQLSGSTICSWEAAVFIFKAKSSCYSWGLFLTFAKTLSASMKTLTEGSKNVQNHKYWCSGCKTDKLKRPNYFFEVLGKWTQELWTHSMNCSPECLCAGSLFHWQRSMNHNEGWLHCRQ